MNPAVSGTQAVSPSQTTTRPARRPLERAFWVISLMILLVHVLFVLVNFRATGDLLRDGLARDGAGRESLFALNLHAESLHMQQFAAHVALMPGVHDLFLQAHAAVHAEGGGGGGERSARVRQELFDRVAPAWLGLSDDYRLRQLHFHLGPGDTSFLRVHSPQHFGDDLSGIRHTITHAIRFNRATAGFESGRVYAGIRGVVPVTDRGPGQDGRVIGAIEAGSSFDHMLKLLEKDRGASYAVLMTGDHFRATHWPDRAERVTASNPLIDDWFVEASTDTDMVRRLLQDPEARGALGQRQPVIVRVDDTPFAVYSFPFRDYLRTVEPERPPIGVGITWQDATPALASADASLRINLVLGIAGFVVVESLLVLGWGFARRRLQRVIDGQVDELSRTNAAMRHEIERRLRSERKLTNYQSRLEATVAERTRTLRETVDALKQEVEQRGLVESDLQRERDQARVTLHSIADGVITADTVGRVQYLNPAAERLTGWTLEAAAGRPIEEVFPARDLERGGRPLAHRRCLSGECECQHGENTELTRRDGATMLVEHSVSPIRAADGATLGLVLVFHDDTEARELAVQLSYHASHDALTGLINRRAIELELEEALRESQSDDSRHAFLYIDLDQFKIVNDTCGHVAGDELLRQVGKLLQARTRQADRLARLGGDEFGLLLRHCPPDKAREIADDLLGVLLTFRFVWQDNAFKIGASIGIAVIERHAESVQAVLSLADAACYLAKEKGRGRVQLSMPDDAELLVRQGEMHWVTRIQQALAEDRLVLFSQPILPVAAGTGAQPHQEILVRMIDEKGELVPPSAFIPAAERYGVMHDVDRWVIDRTFQLIARHATLWPASDEGFYAINISGDTLAAEGILAYIHARLDAHAIDPRRICFEVTETAAIANLASALDLMQVLKAAGCRFALDDFGSGLSSFGYLKALPVDYLKIDGAFVRNLDQEPMDRVMVQAINSVGHAMGLKTIAECVESEAVLKELERIGVDYAQGFGLGMPAAFEQERRPQPEDSSAAG